MRPPPFDAIALVLAAGAACAPHTAVSPDRLVDVHRIAVVGRVEKGPRVEVARSPGGLALFPGENDARAVDERITAAVTKKATRFQIGERLRFGVVRALPSRAPWTALVPAVDVASVLETLLVESGGEAPDFDALRSLRADAVLDLAVNEYGVARRGASVGVYATATARLFTLEGRHTIYRRTVTLDDPAEGQGDLEPLGLVTGEGGYRQALEGLFGRIGAQFAADLGGREKLVPTPASSAPTAPRSSDSQESNP